MKRGGRLKRTPFRASKRAKARKITVKDLDKLCKKLVFLRDVGVCRWCKNQLGVDWSHIFSRRYHSIRWDPRNSFAGCKSCHILFHAQPVTAGRWCELEFGSDVLTGLRLKIGSKIDRAAIKLELEQEIAALEAKLPV